MNHAKFNAFHDCVGVCDACESALSDWDYQEGVCPDCLETLESEDNNDNGDNNE